ncbi:MAG: diphosphomevalonate decarboxylase [Candidatus Binatia bacterium]|nr:diphosphomevalonate decarboxylase [Candidatus Binatia bacterium]
MPEAVARASANVALVKYWGKRDEVRNLPAVGSISITLADLLASARVRVANDSSARFTSRGHVVTGSAAERMAAYLDWIAEALGSEERLTTDVDANFPVGAGLASSAAIHCAVAAASASALAASVDLPRLSRLARVGSGSAARSVYGGWVEWHHGKRTDGEDSGATQLLEQKEWPVAMVVAVVNEGPKEIPSRDAMRHVARSSPLYPAWIEAQGADLAAMRTAIAARDFTAVGTIAEENCLRMHAITFAARPPVVYWSPVTMAAMEAVCALRKSGCEAYFTIDAGPQVKVLCAPGDVETVAEAMGQVPGVIRVLRSALGGGVEVLEGPTPWK